MKKLSEIIGEKRVRKIRISADGKRTVRYTCDGDGEVLKNGICKRENGADRIKRKKAAKKAARKRKAHKSSIVQKIKRAAARRK